MSGLMASAKTEEQKEALRKVEEAIERRDLGSIIHYEHSQFRVLRIVCRSPFNPLDWAMTEVYVTEEGKIFIGKIFEVQEDSIAEFMKD